MYRNQDSGLRQASLPDSKVSSAAFQSIIRRPSKYHPLKVKVSSVEKQSIIRWKATDDTFVLVVVDSGIFYAGFCKGFLALHAGAAFAAMMLTTLVATPRLRVVDT